MIRPKSVTRWVVLSLTGLVLVFGHADAQQNQASRFGRLDDRNGVKLQEAGVVAEIES